MVVKNLTPHAITLTDSLGDCILAVVPPEAVPARCREETETVATIRLGNVEVPVIRKKLGDVENLPPPQPGVVYIVSLVVAQAAKYRDDLLIPGDLIRDENGRVVGCRSLAKV